MSLLTEKHYCGNFCKVPVTDILNYGGTIQIEDNCKRKNNGAVLLQFNWRKLAPSVNWEKQTSSLFLTDAGDLSRFSQVRPEREQLACDTRINNPSILFVVVLKQSLPGFLLVHSRGVCP